MGLLCIYRLPGMAYLGDQQEPGEREAAESHMHCHIGKPWTCCIEHEEAWRMNCLSLGGK